MRSILVRSMLPRSLSVVNVGAVIAGLFALNGVGLVRGWRGVSLARQGHLDTTAHLRRELPDFPSSRPSRLPRS